MHSWRWGAGDARVTYELALRAAWDVIQLLERPGNELPELEAVREACRRAEELHRICRWLKEAADPLPLLLDPELQVLDGEFIHPPED